MLDGREEMKYLLIELYNGKSRYINEDALKEWVGNSNPGKVGPEGARVWTLEEHIIVKCPNLRVEADEFMTIGLPGGAD
jgi:hypothetical protein